MLTKKELVWMIIVIIIMEFIILFPLPEKMNILIILVPIIIIFTSVFAKKIASGFFNIKIEHKIWEFQRYGFYRRSILKKPFPIGLIFAILLSIISLGMIRSFLFLQFESENIPEKRILKKRGLKRKLEINDSDLGLTAAWGFYSLLVLALIGSIIKFPDLARYSIFYGIWNLLPVGQLDGTKLFFGSLFNWIMLVVFYIIALLIIFI